MPKRENNIERKEQLEKLALYSMTTFIITFISAIIVGYTYEKIPDIIYLFNIPFSLTFFVVTYSLAMIAVIISIYKIMNNKNSNNKNNLNKHGIA